jgi:hypothetical protein
LGSATADTSAFAFFAQPVPVCHALALMVEQPLPAPLQADSVQPRVAVVDLRRLVPPTATTCENDAGDSTP